MASLSLIRIGVTLLSISLVAAKHDASICNPSFENNNTVQCYCVKDNRETDIIRAADCYLTVDSVPANDKVWDLFEALKSAHKITFSNTRGIPFKYVPTKALRHTQAAQKIDIKNGNIVKVQAFAFANLSNIEEISLRDSQITTLDTNAFAHHKELITINLDKNAIVEINRKVFVNLPALEKLFLTSNTITTIHDRAFVYLTNLRELEINVNKIFSLNSETFYSLTNLQKLDLSNNNLEVIGDNTFKPLVNLKSLNLDSNNIQVVDAKAFHGLGNLEVLSLAHNKLSDIDNAMTFVGLPQLKLLGLKGNMLKELKSDVMSPILNNFYQATSNLDVEDNQFPCDCTLDWFLYLMNTTHSKTLKNAMENLKCLPDPKLKEQWTKIEESDKANGQIFEEEETQQANDYEYYDETQLNGKLFYTDIRYLLKCSGPDFGLVPSLKTDVKPTTVKVPTKTTTTEANKHSTINTEKPKSIPVRNQGLLDLALEETTPKSDEGEKITKTVEMKADLYTTSRLATVSANPLVNDNVYENMASDEAKPDKLKAHRSIQDDFDVPNTGSNAPKTITNIFLVPMVLLRILY